MVTEKTTLTIILEGDDIGLFKSIITKTNSNFIGFSKSSPDLTGDEVKLLDKLDKKLNKKKDE